MRQHRTAKADMKLKRINMRMQIKARARARTRTHINTLANGAVAECASEPVFFNRIERQCFVKFLDRCRKYGAAKIAFKDCFQITTKERSEMHNKCYYICRKQKQKKTKKSREKHSILASVMRMYSSSTVKIVLSYCGMRSW